ncbi:RluA family pseudouridine synthase [Patescibacteria group bacterium]|nr:RluA family pseudouridine synthase [Patescibacteria group bacterium]
MELPILFQDADIVVIDKPSGVMTHPDGHSTDETASDWFAAHYPDSSEVGEMQRLQNGSEIRRPGIVHRLDRETSGVLVFAKTPAAHEFLKKAFHDREVHKTYLAFVYGVPKERKGYIEFSIGRSRKDFRLRSAQPKAKGILREAITRYEVISDIGTHSLLKVNPETGRTHQIRVHLKAIHHPVVCDSLYAPKQKCDLGFNRLGLHAYQLDLPLPPGERMTITATPPPDLAAAITTFPGTEVFRAL